MTKRPSDDPEPEQLPADRDRPGLHPTPPMAGRPVVRPKTGGYDPDAPDPPEDPVPTPHAGDTRVLLTGDNRSVTTEAWVPTEAFGFRINIDGQFYEHVDTAADSGTWIFAPTR